LLQALVHSAEPRRPARGLPATSALDNRTERAVMDAVRNLAHAKTIVMIAHRLSTVRVCDTIHLLEHGRCVASGTYDELVAHNRSFRELAQAAS